LTISGDICVSLQKYNEALEYFDHAYSVDSVYCSCLYSKALMFEKTGDIRNIIKTWESVVNLYVREGFDVGPELDMPWEHIQMLKSKINM